jgi:ceramide glucosyltransferase
VLGVSLRLASEIILVACVVSAIYLACSLGLLRAFARRRDQPDPRRPPATILKPLRGPEARLYDNLRSFCEQDYPVFQVVFGVRDPKDPAVAVVERLIRELPDRDLALVVDDRLIGANHKVSNLVNMYEAAKYDHLVIADSDMRVGPTYLATVLGPLQDPGVGVVTCLYSGRSLGGVWSALGAMFVQEWFLPSVLVGRVLWPDRFCFGATMAVRRQSLEAVGGFPALAEYLADDYMLGELLNRRRLRVWLSSYVVENTVAESTLGRLFSHELRWARTIRTVQPLGYALSFLTYAIVLAVLHLLVSSASALGAVVLGAALALRVSLHYAVRAQLCLREPARPWLLPVRDALCFIVWVASFFGRTVRWGEETFRVTADGRLRAHGGSSRC